MAKTSSTSAAAATQRDPINLLAEIVECGIARFEEYGFPRFGAMR